MSIHTALYGNVKLLRTYCRPCQTEAFVIDGRAQCCDAPVEASGRTKVKRVVEPEQTRSQPTLKAKREILERQNNQCLYCHKTFEDWFHFRGKLRRVRLAWDHLVPFAYSQNNSNANFVAACFICNGWKSALVFQTLEEAQVFLGAKWASEDKGGAQ